jgi:Cu-Zn family superoxide dismutase
VIPLILRQFLMAIVASMVLCATARAADPTATMNKVSPDGVGDAIGTVRVVGSADGVVLNLNLNGLPPGLHGLHLHESGNCGPATVNGASVAAGAAGGHWDPDHTAKHAGPMGEGHAGDLPVLEVLTDGSVTKSLIVPRIKDIELTRGHALVIHAGGDNYSDAPAPLGGGGARIACGVLE